MIETLHKEQIEKIKIQYQQIIENPESISRREFIRIFNCFKNALNTGEIHVVENNAGTWKTNHWVKEMILLGFKFGELKSYGKYQQNYFDKDTLGQKTITLDDNIRMISQNVSVRDGCYVAPNVILMPPCFVNIGAYVDEGTLVDSNTLVGSCAYIGKRVHLGAGTQIGGVLEPINATPVIIEDDCFIGGNCGIYDGIIIKKHVTIGGGTIITNKMPIYDMVKNKIIKGDAQTPLIIPEGAVVVQGARPYLHNVSDWPDLFLQTPIIIRYNNGTSSIKMEDLLRNGGQS